MLSHLYGPALTAQHDCWKNQIFDYTDLVGKVMSLLFNMLSRFVIAFLPKNNRRLQSPSAVKKIKSVTASTFSPYICHEVEASLVAQMVKKKKKKSACNAGDPGSIPGLGRSPGGGNGNPLQYSCLENPMDRGAGGPESMESQRVKTGLSKNTRDRTRYHDLSFFNVEF